MCCANSNGIRKEAYPAVAARFRAAFRDAFSALTAMPEAGSPKRIATAPLAELRTWPVKGFDELRIYYLHELDDVVILRVLHGKRDIGRILEGEVVEERVRMEDQARRKP